MTASLTTPHKPEPHAEYPTQFQPLRHLNPRIQTQQLKHPRPTQTSGPSPSHHTDKPHNSPATTSKSNHPEPHKTTPVGTAASKSTPSRLPHPRSFGPSPSTLVIGPGNSLFQRGDLLFLRQAIRVSREFGSSSTCWRACSRRGWRRRRSRRWLATRARIPRVRRRCRRPMSSR
jgi:hypothetical protein